MTRVPSLMHFMSIMSSNSCGRFNKGAFCDDVVALVAGFCFFFGLFDGELVLRAQWTFLVEAGFLVRGFRGLALRVLARNIFSCLDTPGEAAVAVGFIFEAGFLSAVFDDDDGDGAI